MVHEQRFQEALERAEPAERLLRHAQAAEGHYLTALNLCPEDAVRDLGPMHCQLGNLYAKVGKFESARGHYEQGIACFEKTGDRFSAGQARYNMASMYGQRSIGETGRAQQRALLLRARAYAEAALRDFQHYQGRAATDEADAQRLIALIDQDLAKLPQ